MVGTARCAVRVINCIAARRADTAARRPYREEKKESAGAKKIFLALVGGSLLAIPPPLIYAGKTAAESGLTRTAIVSVRDKTATQPGRVAADGGRRGFEGQRAA